MLSLLALVLINLSSCKETDPSPAPEVIETPPVPKFKNIEVGNGSGNLVIDGTLLTLDCNDTIRINAGSYNSITIKNINSTDSCNIVVTNKGLVELNGDQRQLHLRNLEGVIITGNGDPALPFGFVIQKSKFRASIITQPFNRITLQHFKFKDLGFYCFINSENKEYTGAEDSYARDIKLLNISCENTGHLFQFSGAVEQTKITGYLKGLEVANIHFFNSNGGSAVACGNVEDYNIHDNVVENVNATNNEHNGIFFMQGNGKFYNNMITNHQGNALRAWTFTIGTTPRQLLVYNNIIVNSRKYSAFEAQSFTRFMRNDVTYANVMVYNNTVGSINMSKSWYGGILDTYNLQGGYCKVFNNLAFDFPSPNPKDNIINQQGITIPEVSNNLYFNTAQEAGFSDQTTYTLTTGSPAKNKGSIVRSMLTDYYGNARSRMNPSIGAVE